MLKVSNDTSSTRVQYALARERIKATRENQRCRPRFEGPSNRGPSCGNFFARNGRDVDRSRIWFTSIDSARRILMYTRNSNRAEANSKVYVHVCTPFRNVEKVN